MNKEDKRPLTRGGTPKQTYILQKRYVKGE